MKKLFRNMLLPLTGAMFLTSVATAQQTVHVDSDFEGGEYTPPQNLGDGFWQASSSKPADSWEVWDTDPDGTANTSLWIKGGNINLVYTEGWGTLAATPSDTEPLLWQFRFYDFMEDPEGGPSQHYTTLQVVHGESWQATIFAFGPFNSETRTKYSIRSYPARNWEPVIDRSEGWHTVSFVIKASTFAVYFDEDPYSPLSTPVYERSYSATSLPAGEVLVFDTLQVGGSSSNAVEAFLWDDIYLVNDRALGPASEFVKQPSPAFTWRQPGDSISYNVEVEGVEPFEYQWVLEGEPLVDDDRISGSTTDTLTITDLRVEDAGKYRLVVTDGVGAVSASNSAELMMLLEHEVLLNAIELPEDAILPRVSDWTRSPGSGWYGAYYTTQVQPGPDVVEKSVTFRPEITKTGNYRVQTWFQPSFPDGNRTKAAAYIVHHADGEDTVSISQQVGGALEFWHDIGTFRFEEGTDGYVKISNLFLADDEFLASKLVFADAVRWIPVDAPIVDGDGPSVAIVRTEAGDIELLIEGEPETTYTIQAVDNLGDEWADLGTEATDSDGKAVFTDSEAGDAPRRFYRVVIE